MVDKNIQNIFDQFQHNSHFKNVAELTSGHINDTYVVFTQSGPKFILQRINGFVFENVQGLINNKVVVSKHLHVKYNRTKEYQTLTFISTHDHKYYYKDQEQSYWNLMLFIEQSKSFERVTTPDLAQEAGKLFGSFINETSDLNMNELVAPIPNFHSMKFRLGEFRNALKNASEERKTLSSKEIEKVLGLKDEMLLLQNLTEEGQIPVRVTHNDTKISNVLFDKNDKAICVIDLDTVMPGIIHYDFGDAIRTICTNAEEDEKDLTKVTFNLSFFRAFTKGFLLKLKHISGIEAEHLAYSAKAMTFIMGLRMLTDFLNNDIYYKTAYDLHNLDRAKNQLKLLDEIEYYMTEMQDIVKESLS